MASANFRTLQRLLPSGGIVHARANKATRSSCEMEIDLPTPRIVPEFLLPHLQETPSPLGAHSEAQSGMFAISLKLFSLAVKKNHPGSLRHVLLGLSRAYPHLERCRLLRYQINPTACAHTASFMETMVSTFFKHATLGTLGYLFLSHTWYKTADKLSGVGQSCVE